MKIDPAILVFALLIAHYSSAAESLDLRMSGSVKPGACTLTMTSDGVFDFGSISADELRKSNYRNLQSMRNTLSVTCSSSTLVAITAIDNRSGTASSNIVGDEYLFGLGRDASGNAIGGYYIAASNHLINGQKGFPTSSPDGGDNWTSDSFLRPAPNVLHSWTTVPGSSPEATSAVMIELIAAPIIAPSDSLDTSQEITLDGSATIELVYL